jgi:SRSO17 transposase
MQRLLNQACWDPWGMRADLREYVFEELGDDSGVLVVDETGFIKKGTGSAGVQRQYSGTAGRVENCQLGIFLAYASARGRALIDAELYLPRSWLADRGRCAGVGIPVEAKFATKPALAQAMLERALGAGGVPASWVTADEAYGQDHKFRLYLEKRRIAYVVAVPKSQSLGPGIGYGNGGSRADAVTTDAPPDAWKKLSAGDGAKARAYMTGRWRPWNHTRATTSLARARSSDGSWSAAVCPPTSRVSWNWPSTCASALPAPPCRS